MKHQLWHESVLELYKQNMSGRKIAKELGMAKSTVNDFLKLHRDSEKVKCKESNGLNYLYFDLETSLMQGYFFDIWDVNIPMSRVTKQSHLLSASWAFNDEEPQGVRLTPEDVKTGNDLEIVIKLIKALNKCDVAVSFNGRKFDFKKLNTRAIYWGLPPIVIPKNIDLMLDAKRLFKFPSNSMQNISNYLGLEGKISTSSSRLWERCMDFENYEVCEQALEEMLTYNLQDIRATRDLHRRFMGWSKSTPNIGTIVNSKLNDCSLRCIHCGSDDVAKMELTGYNGEVESMKGYTAMSSFDLYRCGNTTCRGVSRISSTGKQLVNNL